MNKKKIVCFLIGYLLIGLGSIMYLFGTRMEKNDVIKINRIAKSVLAAWDDLSKGDYGELQYPFCVVDKNDEVLYQSGDAATDTTIEAIENGDLILPIKRENELLGTVIITTNPEENYQNTKKELLVVFSVIYLFLLGIMIYFYSFLQERHECHEIRNLRMQAGKYYCCKELIGVEKKAALSF